MWILNIWNSRLTCASEIEGDDKTVLNGNLIKRIVSGGDSIKARGNYMNEVEIVPAFTPWFMYNQWYEVEPYDASETLTLFTCPSKFVENERLIEGCDILKLKDGTKVRVGAIPAKENPKYETGMILASDLSTNARGPMTIDINNDVEEVL